MTISDTHVIGTDIAHISANISAIIISWWNERENARQNITLEVECDKMIQKTSMGHKLDIEEVINKKSCFSFLKMTS